jgi:hypothetical protein
LPVDIPIEMHGGFERGEDFLVVCTQSCNLVSPDFEGNPFAEVIAARPISRLNERSREATGRHGRRFHGEDEVWVATPGVWASTVADALAALRALTERGAVLCVASTGRRYRYQPEAADALALAEAIGAENQRAATAAARASAAKRRATRDVDAAEQWKEAKRLWTDPAVTVTAAAERSGIPLRTLYRRLGPKGTEPFVGGRRRGKGRRK